jgi:hypothetical protein
MHSICACSGQQARTGAVRSRGDRAGEGLDVDVPEVRQREAVTVELVAQALQPDAGLDADARGAVRVAADVEDPVHGVEPEQHAVGRDER